MYTKRSIQKRIQDFYNNRYCPNKDNDENCIDDYTQQCALQWQQGKPIINTEYIHRDNDQYTLERIHDFQIHNKPYRCGIRDEAWWSEQKNNKECKPWKPLFENIWKFIKDIYENDNTLYSLIPSIDQYIPKKMKVFNPIVTTSSTVNPKKAMASLIHILVVPNPSHLKLYNGISLQKEHIPFVNTMMKVGLAIAEKQRETLFNVDTITRWHNTYNNSTKEQDISLEKWLQQDSVVPYYDGFTCNDNNKEMISSLKSCKTWKDSLIISNVPQISGEKFVNGMDLTPEKASIVSRSIEEKGTLPPPQWHIGFHLHPDHTVGLLHMHIVDTTLMTRTGANEHFYKTALWKDLRKVIEER